MSESNGLSPTPPPPPPPPQQTRAPGGPVSQQTSHAHHINGPAWDTGGPVSQQTSHAHHINGPAWDTGGPVSQQTSHSHHINGPAWDTWRTSITTNKPCPSYQWTRLGHLEDQYHNKQVTPITSTDQLGTPGGPVSQQTSHAHHINGPAWDTWRTSITTNKPGPSHQWTSLGHLEDQYHNKQVTPITSTDQVGTLGGPVSQQTSHAHHINGPGWDTWRTSITTNKSRPSHQRTSLGHLEDQYHNKQATPITSMDQLGTLGGPVSQQTSHAHQINLPM